jgi:TetR/AcrR family transcriptional regulator
MNGNFTGVAMPEEQLSRKEREKLRQRSEILDVALILFSERGFHNVSMAEIAEKAEFAIGTIYKFFPNKVDLYRALLLEQSKTFESVLRPILEADGDEREIVVEYVRAKLKVLSENISFIRLYIAESRGVTFNVNTLVVEEIHRRYYENLCRLASIIERGVRRGCFLNIADPFQLALSLDSSINAFLLVSLEFPERHPYPDDPKAILDIYFKGLLAQSDALKPL